MQALYLTPNLHFWGQAASRIAAWLDARQIAAADCCVLLPQAVQQGLLRRAWLERKPGSWVLPRTTTLAALRELVLLAAALDPADPAQQQLDCLQTLQSQRRFGAALSTPQRLPARLQLCRELLQLRAALIQRAADPLELAERLQADATDGDDARWTLELAAAQLEQDAAWAQRALVDAFLRQQCRALVWIDDGSSDPQALALLQRMDAAGLPVLCLQARCSGGLGAALLHAAQGQRPRSAARARIVLQRRLRWLPPDLLEIQARAVLAAVLEQRARDPRARIAIVAVDRRLSRRLNALLARLRVPVLDEAGWLLSTTGAAGALPLLFELASANPGCDTLLDFLKQPGVCSAAGLDAGELDAIEADLRRQGLHDLAGWQAWAEAGPTHATVLRHLERCHEPWRALGGAVSVAAALSVLLEVAARSGLQSVWQTDPAGAQLLQWLQARAATRSELRLDRDGWRVWLEHELERALYRPPTPQPDDSTEPVRLLSLDDAGLRPWDLCVIAGADAGNFPPPQLPAAGLSDALCLRLGLPDRAALRAQQLQRIAALFQGSRQLLVVESSPRPDHPGSSPLLQLWAWCFGLQAQAQPVGSLPLQALSAAELEQLAPIAGAGRAAADDIAMRWSPSSYADLRACPYRYFARRVLRLGETDDLLPDYSKRDFGVVLHAILERFHAEPVPDSARRERLDQLAEQHWQRAGALAEPFAAVWPAVRDNYLDWLSEWQRQGWQVQAEEQKLQRVIDPDGLQLEGRIDRVDHAPQGLFAIDYKTGSASTLRARMQRWGEDTQLLAYGLLLGADRREDVAAGYLMLDEKPGARGKPGYDLLPWPADALSEQAAALAQQLADDWQQLRQGRPMRALGEPPLCDHCEAAVLCRRDHRLAFDREEPKR